MNTVELATYSLEKMGRKMRLLSSPSVKPTSHGTPGNKQVLSHHTFKPLRVSVSYKRAAVSKSLFTRYDRNTSNSAVSPIMRDDFLPDKNGWANT